MLYASLNVDDWLGSSDGAKQPNILALTLVFFMLHFVVCVQDVALDAWALTMLQRRVRRRRC